MVEKRPPPDGNLENGDSKRPRSNNGSPAPGATNGASNQAAVTDDERKKSSMAERLAALKARVGTKTQPPSAPAQPPTTTSASSNVNVDASARIAAMKARLSAVSSGSAAAPVGVTQSSTTAPVPSAIDGGESGRAAISAQIAAFKARAMQNQQQRASSSTPAPPPTRDEAASTKPQRQRYHQEAPLPPVREDNVAKARGGLGIGLHPALLGDTGKSKDQTDKRKQAPKVNPYLAQNVAPDIEVNDDPTFDSRLSKAPADRKARSMVFNQKGKYIAQAEEIRAQEKLDLMNQEMQAEAKKRDIEERTERSYLVKQPPEIEWWDEGLVANGSYENISEPGGLKMELITAYVQHPVLLEPPQERLLLVAKPMYMTKKEMAKMRRQRRMENHKEEQAKIRLGLVEPPPPKVKKSNLMRVLGQEAVKDPTAVEARVNREIAARLEKHEAENEARKLTKEQRHEKLTAQQEADAARGLKVAVFRVDNLSNGQHRFKIDINAKQQSLTGMVILHPKMCLVIVEGGIHSVNAYTKLMTKRIKWSENAIPLIDKEVREEEDKDWLKPLDSNGQLKDLSGNCCKLVWEGDEKTRAFRRWATRVCETDGEAKDALAKMRMENMWTLAQSIEMQD